MPSELKVNKLSPYTGSTLTLGDSGDTIAITSGASLTGFTSTGIDDNATNTAVTIDSSQNVGIGTTSPSVTFDAEADGATVAHFNRATSDGDILELQKDGTTVGSIGYISSGLYIDGESGHAGLRFGGADISPRDGGADADAAIQLGSSSNRFTDLYLSGSAYLGGTTSANALDDYEEGNWTPTLTDGTNNAVSYNVRNGYYTKIGREVFIRVYLRTTNLGSISTNLRISGLPFTSSNLGNSRSSLAVGFTTGLSITAGESVTAFVEENKDYIVLYLTDATTGTTALQPTEWTSDGRISATGSYIID